MESFKQYAYIWSPLFSTRQNEIRYLRENKLGEATTRQQSDVSAILKRFLEISCEGDIERYSYRSIQLENFLGIIDVRELETGSLRTSKRLVLVDDRNNLTASRKNPGGESRPFQGPLTAPQLYELLQKPRYARESESAALANAERRLVYINDVDRFNVLAIAGTAPKSQISVLRDFIHRYLAYGAFFGVAIPSKTFNLTFALEFHLPFYAWRKCTELRLDPRLMKNGDPLRYAQRVVPVNSKKPSSGGDQMHECIYEAQISVMVTGLDEWFWTGYCFVDAYYHKDGVGESAEIFADEFGGLPKKMEPISGGKWELDIPVWDPRGYFLRILLCRTEQVSQEWKNAVYRLLQETKSYTSRDTSSDQLPKDYDITQEEGYKWTIRILRQFTNLLTKIIDSWKIFKGGEIGYFYPQGPTSLPRESWGRYLASIDKCVTELIDLQGSLLHQTEMLENMTNSLSTHAALAENKITRLQSKFVRALTVITILYLPPSLASTIFSMQQSVFKTPIHLIDYISLMLGILALTLALLVVVNEGTRDFAVWVMRHWIGKLIHTIEESKESFQFRSSGRSRTNSSDSGIEMDEQMEAGRMSGSDNQDMAV